MSENEQINNITTYSIEPLTGSQIVEKQRKILPKYEINTLLNLSLMHSEGSTQIRSAVNTFEGMVRNPVLEQMELRDKFLNEIVHPKDIADHNFQEMERATALKWYLSLNRLFKAERFRKISTHNPDGRLQIVIPGCSLGFEIGGILDFFNEQRIPVDIHAVDLREAGKERGFMNLENREKVRGSKVEFYSNTDARNFCKNKIYDLVILRHPGFVFEMIEYYIWKQIIEELVLTKPELFIVSTYNHSLSDDPYYIEEVLGFRGKKEVYEGEVIQKLLEQHGYDTQDDSWIMDDLLRYPRSPYMTAYESKDGKLEFTLPVDREIGIFWKPTNAPELKL